MVGRKTLTTVAGCVVAVAIAVLLWRVDPMDAAWMPKCAVHRFTGLQCPGCGISRAAHALLHGHMAEAWSHNLFLIVSLPYLAALIAVETVPRLRRNPRLYRVVYGPEAAIGFVALSFVWFVVRNILGI